MCVCNAMRIICVCVNTMLIVRLNVSLNSIYYFFFFFSSISLLFHKPLSHDWDTLCTSMQVHGQNGYWPTIPLVCAIVRTFTHTHTLSPNFQYLLPVFLWAKHFLSGLFSPQTKLWPCMFIFEMEFVLVRVCLCV